MGDVPDKIGPQKIAHLEQQKQKLTEALERIRDKALGTQDGLAKSQEKYAKACNSDVTKHIEFAETIEEMAQQALDEVDAQED